MAEDYHRLGATAARNDLTLSQWLRAEAMGQCAQDEIYAATRAVEAVSA